MDTRKIVLGTLLILLSSALLFASGARNVEVPMLVLAAASTLLAIGTLLFGTSEAEGARQV